MNNQTYHILYQGTTVTIEEKKSKFIAISKQAESQEQAQEFIDQVKKEYWDARHHCYAYVIGEQNEVLKCSDDKEPAKTAGRPILDTILSNALHNTIVVVVRYFGGTLLGTGGLVRAYQKAASEVINNSIVLDLMEGTKADLRTEYTNVGKIQYILAEQNGIILDTKYEEKVYFSILLPDDQRDLILKKMQNQMNNTVQITLGKKVRYAFWENEIKIF